MRIFFDTEFRDDGRIIDLISIGLVREDGEELYLVSSEFDVARAEADPWLRQNVLAHIPESLQRYPRRHMADVISNFAFEDDPVFMAYYAGYDWVALCQLFGRMLDIPAHWPKHCQDLKQYADDRQIILPKQVVGAHHALADARWVAESYEYCQSFATGRG